MLNFTIMDHNDHRPDGEMGTVTFELGQLTEDAVKEGNESAILKDGKERGMLRYDLYASDLSPYMRLTVLTGRSIQS